MISFYLGTHMTNWLDGPPAGAPLFISHVRLRERKSYPRAARNWSLDSGGYSQLGMRGSWLDTPRQYANMTRRYSKEIGNLDWAAIQDYMCEPNVIAMTGLSVKKHIALTVRSYIELRSIAPEIKWTPVIQGLRLSEYMYCINEYAKEGIDLTSFDTVGIGSVCRRQATREAVDIMKEISMIGISIHAFGFKIQGLRNAGRYITSADSMAWSTDARHSPPIYGHTHKNCANCKEYAAAWYRERIAYQLRKYI